MTSEQRYAEAYVWALLPGQTQRVVAGRLAREGRSFLFNYGRSYLAREEAVSLYEPELPFARRRPAASGRTVDAQLPA